MAFRFNPFSGTFDQTGSSGGASYIDGEVAAYANLPLDGTAPLDSAWLVRTATGTFFTGGSKPAGIYIRTGTLGVSRDADYTYAGTMPDVFSDANFTLYDNANTSKNLKFQLSGISASTTTTLTVPNASGTLVLGNDARIATIGSGTINTTENGGSLNLSDSGGSINTSEGGGSINTIKGGSINTYGEVGFSGGSINTYADPNANGGSINTHGTDGAPGGSINTDGGGGSINTRGTGSIQLGETGTRTTLVGSAATTDKTVTLPNATGTVALTTMNSGFIAASAPLFDLAQTWNNAAVAFTSLKLNVTATLAASNSLLADLQIGGAPVFSVARISSTAGNVGAWLYGTYSSAGANYERGFMRWSAAAGTFQIGTEKLGTGSARALQLQTDGTARLTITSGGGLLIGDGTAQANNFFGWSGNGGFRAQQTSTGVITLFNWNEDGFNRLQFGGTTASFPALKRSSTVLQSRLADDSAFAPLQGQLRIHQNAVAETPTATHTMTLYDAAGTAYKVLCVAA